MFLINFFTSFNLNFFTGFILTVSFYQLILVKLTILTLLATLTARFRSYNRWCKWTLFKFSGFFSLFVFIQFPFSSHWNRTTFFALTSDGGTSSWVVFVFWLWFSSNLW